jgi:hypothetical protein
LDKRKRREGKGRIDERREGEELIEERKKGSEEMKREHGRVSGGRARKE